MFIASVIKLLQLKQNKTFLSGENVDIKFSIRGHLTIFLRLQLFATLKPSTFTLLALCFDTEVLYTFQN